MAEAFRLDFKALLGLKPAKRDGAHASMGPKGRTEAEARGLWWIHGEPHDLESFVKSHPGGELAIRLGQGTDCTELFMSYHVANGVATQMLEQYRVGSAQRATPVPAPSPLKLDLERMVREHFGPGRSAHRATRSHMLLCAAFSVCYAACWVGWLFGNVPSMLVLPFIGWLTMVNTSHDASHFAFSRSPAVNFVMTFTSIPLFYSPMTWYYQHVMSHHNNCNDPERDVDVHHFAPMKLHARDTSPTPHGGHLLFDYIKPLLVPVHLVMGVPLFCCGLLDNEAYDDHFQASIWMPPGLKPHFKYKVCNVVAPISFVAVILLPLRLFFLGALSFSMAAAFTLYPMAISSLLFLTYTQVSHVQPEVQTAEATAHPDCYVRNCLTSCDYSTDSHFWRIMSGGLNTQSIHHSLPYINSCHYTDLYPKFEAVVNKHGLKLASRRSLWHATCTGCKHVWTINRSGEQLDTVRKVISDFTSQIVHAAPSRKSMAKAAAAAVLVPSM